MKEIGAEYQLSYYDSDTHCWYDGPKSYDLGYVTSFYEKYKLKYKAKKPRIYELKTVIEKTRIL